MGHSPIADLLSRFQRRSQYGGTSHYAADTQGVAGVGGEGERDGCGRCIPFGYSLYCSLLGKDVLHLFQDESKFC